MDGAIPMLSHCDVGCVLLVGRSGSEVELWTHHSLLSEPDVIH